MKNKEKIDLVIVATVRPDILEITLNSFNDKLLDNFDMRAIINVDPVGTRGVGGQQDDIVNLCKKYFANIVFRCPKEPSFSQAVRWCWSQVETDLFIHLEDDWCLKKSINSENLLQACTDNNVVSVRFNRRNISTIYNQLSLNPGMFRTAYIKELLTIFNPDKDPEAQFNNKYFSGKPLAFATFPQPKFLSYESNEVFIIDTGGMWRKLHRFYKWDSTKNTETIWRHKKSRIWHTFTHIIKYHLFLAWLRLRYCKKINGNGTTSRRQAR